jgi:hypothetical protein
MVAGVAPKRLDMDVEREKEGDMSCGDRCHLKRHVGRAAADDSRDDWQQRDELRE